MAEIPQDGHVAIRDIKPDLAHLRDAGTSLAAAWFVFCGCNVALPVEPAVYDLLVARPGGIERVQVKTTTFNSKDGWMVQVGRRPYSAGNKAWLIPYDPDLIDLFFIVDGDLTMYVIPSRVIAGRVGIALRSYTKYIVGDASGLMAPRPRAALRELHPSGIGRGGELTCGKRLAGERVPGGAVALGSWVLPAFGDLQPARRPR